MAGSHTSLSVGVEVEALVVARIYQEGGRVSIPFDHGMGYDMVSDFDGVLHRIEVKKSHVGRARPSSTQPVVGETSTRWECDLRARNLSYSRSPDPSTSDSFVISAAESFYIIPTVLLDGLKTLVLRPPGYEPIRRTGSRSKLDTEGFRESWHLLSKEV